MTESVGTAQYTHPSHYNQPSDAATYFLEHIPSWIEHMPELLTKDCLTVEIGALYGGASMFILDKYVKRTGHHHIIDINTNEYIQKNLEPYKGKYTYLLGESETNLRMIPRSSIDFVYIDGNHMSKNVLEDAVNAFYVLKDDGYIVFDDYGWGNNSLEHCRPKTGIDAFAKAYEKHIKIKHVGWQVILQKVKYTMNGDEKSSNYVSS